MPMAEKSLKINYKDADGNKKFHNPLKWWKDHQALYPTLAELARIYLAIMATSAPSERIFNMAGQLILAQRASLGGEMAGKILFVKEHWDWYEKEVNYDEIASEAEG